MNCDFKIIPASDILIISPLLQKLGEYKVPVKVLNQRISEMASQSYECIGIYNSDKLIGICGLWFQTRHYAGKSVEPDHIIIEEEYRNMGLGDKLFKFIYSYALKKECKWVELNTYVSNYPSHKFYYNEGFEILGYHFFKKL